MRLADKTKVEKNCQYKVSFASYSADGPTWKTSGTQRFLGKDTVTLTAKKPSATLDIKKHLPPCYGQIDLYGGGDKFTGAKTPHYPDKKYPTNMIAGWNGGEGVRALKPPSSSPKPSKSPSTSPKPSPSVSASPSPSASVSGVSVGFAFGSGFGDPVGDTVRSTVRGAVDPAGVDPAGAAAAR
ncbi:hypothetical protein ACU686_40145 [Yinghuangia aomiensis]